MFESLWQDVRYALRSLRRTPGFTLAAVITLALGIGANTAIFSVANAVILRPLHAPGAERLVRFAMTYDGTPAWPTGLDGFNSWRQQTAFDDVSAHWLEFANLTSGSYPEQISVARVTNRFLYLFDAPVIKGRTFTVDEDRPGAAPVVVLSTELWRRQFGADPEILGKAISLGGDLRTVVGILDKGFDTEQFTQRPEAWVPFQIDPNAPDGALCFVTGRLKPGVTLGAARTQLGIAADEARRTAPGGKGPQPGFTVVPLREAMTGDASTGLLILGSAVGLVLLIACANVAGLLLVRAIARRREIAIRTALGAGRGRIVRQLLTESVLLAAIGGLLGLVCGTLGIRALLAAFNQVTNLPRIGPDGSGVTTDWRVLLFTLVVSAVAGIVFGLLPAIQAGRSDLTAAIKHTDVASATGVRGNKMRALLVVGEIALALVLLIGAGLLLRTTVALFSVDRGFDLQNVLTMRMSVSGTPFETREGLERLTRDGVDRIQATPGVAVASAACCVPLENVWQLLFVIAGRPPNGTSRSVAGWTFVSPGYFEALQIPLIRGRAFTNADVAGAPGVVLINEAMARRFWPSSDPLRDQVTLGRGMRLGFENDPPRQVIGIVGDVREQSLNRPPRPAMYVPVGQLPDAVTTFFVRQMPLTWIVRTAVDPLSIGASVERALRTASNGLPVTRIRSMNDVAADSIARTRFATLLMTMFGCTASLLAATGIYVMMASSVTQRTHEIGIRMALGARTSAVRIKILVQGMTLALLGIALGTAAAFAVTRLLASFLFGISPRDATVFVWVAALLTSIAFAAVWFPARRASRVDPINALRME